MKNKLAILMVTLIVPLVGTSVSAEILVVPDNNTNNSQTYNNNQQIYNRNQPNRNINQNYNRNNRVTVYENNSRGRNVNVYHRQPPPQKVIYVEQDNRDRRYKSYKKPKVNNSKVIIVLPGLFGGR